MWQRAGAVRLFVEHVTFFYAQDDNANTENVVKLWKVLAATFIYFYKCLLYATMENVHNGVCKTFPSEKIVSKHTDLG